MNLFDLKDKVILITGGCGVLGGGIATYLLDQQATVVLLHYKKGPLIEKVNELNNDNEIDGYIVQLPLPKHIDTQKILMAIDPNKDVDGFHPTNFGKMALN